MYVLFRYIPSSVDLVLFSPMYILGYILAHNQVYLSDKDMNIYGYTLSLSMVKYQTVVLCSDLDAAAGVLPTLPKEQLNKVAWFLEGQGRSFNPNLKMSICSHNMISKISRNLWCKWQQPRSQVWSFLAAGQPRCSCWHCVFNWCGDLISHRRHLGEWMIWVHWYSARVQQFPYSIQQIPYHIGVPPLTDLWPRFLCSPWRFISPVFISIVKPIRHWQLTCACTTLALGQYVYMVPNAMDND